MWHPDDERAASMSGDQTRVWHDPQSEDHANFRTGRACWVDTSPDRPLDQIIAEFPLPANTYWGMIHLDLLDQLAHLPSNYLSIGPYEEAVLLPSGLREAADILRRVAVPLVPGSVDFRVSRRFEPTQLEYWIRLDLSALKTALNDLATFVEGAAKQGYGVQFWL
jgi:hypothetical protein